MLNRFKVRLYICFMYFSYAVMFIMNPFNCFIYYLWRVYYELIVVHIKTMWADLYFRSTIYEKHWSNRQSLHVRMACQVAGARPVDNRTLQPTRAHSNIPTIKPLQLVFPANLYSMPRLPFRASVYTLHC